MMNRPTFTRDNHQRIQAVENSFGLPGKLASPGRILIGEGRLIKLCRRQAKPKVFFLFSDILMYGSIVLEGRLHTSKKIIPLEDIQLEDLEDSTIMKNQWLIKTPRKSFYVAAASPEEKQAWMDHIKDSRAKWLQSAGCQPRSTFAVTWIPDQASAICMRCASKFTTTQRRHHCRNCGFLICGPCSKYRAIVAHIHPTKPVRVCGLCNPSLPSHKKKADIKEKPRPRVNSDGKSFSDDDSVYHEYEMVGHVGERSAEDHNLGSWMSNPEHMHGVYVYLDPKHTSASSTCSH